MEERIKITFKESNKERIKRDIELRKLKRREIKSVEKQEKIKEKASFKDNKKD